MGVYMKKEEEKDYIQFIEAIRLLSKEQREYVMLKIKEYNNKAPRENHIEIINENEST